uniref:Uncharacterized protein n=1 Tax=Anguilla anguilla TaxID=7936 RepID=A0A0E9WXE7_ANGAN
MPPFTWTCNFDVKIYFNKLMKYYCTVTYSINTKYISYMPESYVLNIFMIYTFFLILSEILNILYFRALKTILPNDKNILQCIIILIFKILYSTIYYTKAS